MARAQPWPMPRYSRSTAGMSSVWIASPYGPRFSELTAYESSKKGFSWLIVMTSILAFSKTPPGSGLVQLRYR